MRMILIIDKIPNMSRPPTQVGHRPGWAEINPDVSLDGRRKQQESSAPPDSPGANMSAGGPRSQSDVTGNQDTEMRWLTYCSILLSRIRTPRP